MNKLNVPSLFLSDLDRWEAVMCDLRDNLQLALSCYDDEEVKANGLMLWENQSQMNNSANIKTTKTRTCCQIKFSASSEDLS